MGYELSPTALLFVNILNSLERVHYKAGIFELFVIPMIVPMDKITNWDSAKDFNNL